jgi:hypothetical protein
VETSSVMPDLSRQRGRVSVHLEHVLPIPNTS